MNETESESVNTAQQKAEETAEKTETAMPETDSREGTEEEEPGKKLSGESRAESAERAKQDAVEFARREEAQAAQEEEKRRREAEKQRAREQAESAQKTEAENNNSAVENLQGSEAEEPRRP